MMFDGPGGGNGVFGAGSGRSGGGVAEGIRLFRCGHDVSRADNREKFSNRSSSIIFHPPIEAFELDASILVDLESLAVHASVPVASMPGPHHCRGRFNLLPTSVESGFGRPIPVGGGTIRSAAARLRASGPPGATCRAVADDVRTTTQDFRDACPSSHIVQTTPRPSDILARIRFASPTTRLGD